MKAYDIRTKLGGVRHNHSCCARTIWKKKAILKSQNSSNKVLQVSKLTHNEAYIRIRKIDGAHIHKKVGDTREIDARTNVRKNHIW